jgi:hypothetical protein
MLNKLSKNQKKRVKSSKNSQVKIILNLKNTKTVVFFKYNS